MLRLKLRSKKFIIIALLLAIVMVFLVLNFPYLWLHIRHILQGKSTHTYTYGMTAEQLGMEAGQLYVPALRLRAPIVYVSENSEEVFQDALQHGVVHFPGTAQLGQVGNSYIFGHSSDLAWSKGNYKTVFALLPYIGVGEDVFVSNGKGEVFRYRVTEKYVVGSKDVSVLSQDTQGKKILTLQTSYPLGTALKRYIVRAELKD